MSSSLQIEKLNGENYPSWSIQMRSLLITMDYWTAVENLCPVTASKEEKESWNALDMKALATITLSVKPSELIHIKSCKTAREAWHKLVGIYVTKSPARKVTLFKRLVRFKIQEGSSFSQQINDFSNLVESLKEIDINIPEDFISIVLLCSLPDDYESFIVAMESRDKLPAIEHLKVKVLEENQRRGDKQQGGEEHVFAVKSKQSGTFKIKREDQRENDERRRKNIKCYACGKRGHIKSQCYHNNNKKVMVMSASEGNFIHSENLWIVDSGASSHMSGNKSLFSSLKEYTQKITLASGDCVYAEGIGDVNMKSDFTDITLSNVLFVPSLSANFISVYKVIEHENEVIFSKDNVTAKTKEGEMIFKATSSDGLFVAEFRKNEQLMLAQQTSDCFLWHKRYGHLNERDVLKLSNKEMVRGMCIKSPENFSCVICSLCKISVKPFEHINGYYTKKPLELVHSDICGPMRVSSEGGSRYFISFIDDFSRFITVYFLKRKSDALKVFKEFKHNAETQTGCVLKTLRTDNGTEYLSNEFKNFLISAGISHQTTVCYTPQQNGIAERANRTLVEMTRCMLLESGLPQSLWSEALHTATYLRNRCPTKVLDEKTPYEQWFGRKPSVAHLRIFGCDVVSLNKKPGKSKLLPKGERLTFVGYSLQSKAYRLYNRQQKTIVIARDVIFFESSFSTTKEDREENEDKLDGDNWFAVDINALEADKTHLRDDLHKHCESSTEDSETEVPPGVKRKRGRPKIIRTGERGRPRKLRVVEPAINAMIKGLTEQDPKSVAEAMNSKSAKYWEEAMKEEIENLRRNKTWDLVGKPNDKNIVGCKWVFVTKKKLNGELERHKARLVAQGFSQKQYVDYNETFSPVVRHSAIRMLFAVAAQKQYLVHHIDIVSAYLNGVLEDEVFMRQPENFVDERYPDKVCKLKKSIYGLKQAGRDWNRKLNEVLINIGFKRCKTDNCLYVKRLDEEFIYIAVYVDDILLSCFSEHVLKSIVNDLNKHVDAVDRGPAKYYLGMEIERDGLRGNITIHQEKYVRDLLEKWKMTECKPAKTPIASGSILQKCSKVGCKGDDSFNYQSLIGSLNYLSVISRPDITYAVSMLSQFNSHPEKEHFTAAKHVLRYLKYKPKGMLTYTSSTNGLVSYTDADWGSDMNDRKSYSGFVLFLAGGAIAWESRKQSSVSLSSMEAEYVAMCQGTKEVVYQRSLLQEIGLAEFVKGPTILNCDNQSAQFLVKNPVAHKRSKHIDIRYHYIREKFETNEISIQYVPTANNVADLLTKCLCKEKHEKFCNVLFKIC